MSLISIQAGIDHIPIHHENEIAQSKGYSGKIPAHYWMHVDFLQVNGGKMSKSLNNLYTLEDLEKKGYMPEVYRMFNFSSHYRKKVNFTWEAMESAKTALYRLKQGYQNHLEGKEKVEERTLHYFKNKFLEYINDDLNMPQAMSVVWEVVRYDKKSKELAKLLLDFDKVLGLNIAKKEENEIPQEILDIVNERKIARQEKNWKLSDELREKLNSLGYLVKDNADGMQLEKK